VVPGEGRHHKIKRTDCWGGNEMEAYRYQQLAYLVVPVMLGVEFFLCAKEEKKGKEDNSLGFYLLDLLGFIFFAVFPAVFIFTIWASETKAFPLQDLPLARLDRYAVLFFFMGAWWQVYLFGALRARRMQKRETGRFYLWAPFVILGVYISFLALWVSPWGLKWVSAAWFLLVFVVLNFFSTRAIERSMWILAVFTFFVENIMFIWFDSLV
jgi:hypothetical protein